MNATLARLLTQLYPPQWRERYGPEFEAFLQADRGGLWSAVNVMGSAIYEWLAPTQMSLADARKRPWLFHDPVAIYALVPVLGLAMAYLVACLILWFGWQIFLTGEATPFFRVDGLAMVYLGIGRLLYYGAPIAIGWGIVLVAVCQRSKSFWPGIGLILIALFGSMMQVHASRASGGAGHISMGLALNAVHTLILLLITMLPYAIWQLRIARSYSVGPLR